MHIRYVNFPIVKSESTSKENLIESVIDQPSLVDSIPIEIIMNVFLNASPEDVVTMCKTSPSFYQICNTNYFWKQKLHTDFPKIETKNLSTVELRNIYFDNVYPLRKYQRTIRENKNPPTQFFVGLARMDDETYQKALKYAAKLGKSEMIMKMWDGSVDMLSGETIHQLLKSSANLDYFFLKQILNLNEENFETYITYILQSSNTEKIKNGLKFYLYKKNTLKEIKDFSHFISELFEKIKVEPSIKKWFSNTTKKYLKWIFH